MNLCSICPKPGMCCTHFSLWDKEGSEITFWQADPFYDAKKLMVEKYLPFHPIKIKSYYQTRRGWKYVTLFYGCPKLDSVGRCSIYEGCPKLDSVGRCSIYEDRPSTCRNFVPSSDEICYFWKLV